MAKFKCGIGNPINGDVGTKQGLYWQRAQITIQPGQPDYAANPAVLHPSPMPSENTTQKEEEAKANILVMVAIGMMQTAASGVVAYL